MKKDLTIKDIANSANVSISTVSRVLNGKGRVSDATKRKILKVIKDFEYVPNNIAVSMVKKRTNLILVMVPDLKTPFYSMVIHGVESVAKKYGLFTLVFSTGGSSDIESSFFTGSFSKMVDGVIAIPSTNNVAIYESFRKPIILVDRYVDDTNLDVVVIDNMRGTYLLTEHLIQNGHKDIAFISGPTDLNVGRERLWGYQQALRDYGIEFKQDNIYLNTWYESTGYSSIEKILVCKAKPTAIVAGNSQICIGVLKAFHDNNIRIKEDFSIVSFDDNNFAEFVNPKITVLKRATSEMGCVAVELLMNRINKGNDYTNIEEPRKITLSVSLIKRGSVKDLNIKK